MVILWFILAVALVALAFAITGLFALLRTGIPAVPSSIKRIRWFLDNYPLPASGTLVDLGCGDARFLIEAKRQYPELRCVGYELSPWELVRAQWNTWRAGVHITLHAKNFFHADLSGTAVVYCYLLDSLLPRVEQLLAGQLKPGAVVITHAFPFPSWKPSATIRPAGETRGSFYVYNR